MGEGLTAVKRGRGEAAHPRTDGLLRDEVPPCSQRIAARPGISGATGVHVLDLYSGTDPIKVRVVTAASSATLGRLGEVGISLDAGVDYAWALSTTPFATADEAATREALRLLAGMRSLNAPLPVTAWAETNARHNVAAN